MDDVAREEKMISGQDLATALNAVLVLAGDRRKVKSSRLQEKLIEAAEALGNELAQRGAEMDFVEIPDAENKRAIWTLPMAAGAGEMPERPFLIINVKSLIE